MNGKQYDKEYPPQSEQVPGDWYEQVLSVWEASGGAWRKASRWMHLSELCWANIRWEPTNDIKESSICFWVLCQSEANLWRSGSIFE